MDRSIARQVSRDWTVVSPIHWTGACLLGLLAVLVATHAAAEVKLPNGEYRVQSEDLRVKVPGGVVTVIRTWQAQNIVKGEYRWYVNPAWADLEFEPDIIDGTPKSITRSGSKFERSGNGIYVFDREFFLRETLDAQGDPTGWRWYDRGGNWITYTTPGRILAYGDRNGTVARFERDAANRIERLLDRDAQVVLTYEYASPTSALVTKITDRHGRSVEYHYTGAAQNLTEVIDALGHPWHYGYAGGLMTSRTDPEQRITQILYSGNRVVRVIDPELHAWIYEYDYDRSKRQFTIVERSPEGRTREKRYDIEGRLLRELVGSRLVYTLIRDGAHIDIGRDERGLATRTEYDSNRNPLKITHPDGSFVTATYDPVHNLPLERIDERGIRTAYQYDAKGNLTRLTEAVGLAEQRVTEMTYYPTGERHTRTVKGATAAEDATTTWTWYEDGNLRSVTDPEGHETLYTYTRTPVQDTVERRDARGNTWTTLTNARGWVISTTDPLGHGTTYEYDKVGNRTRQTDALDHATQYVYTKTDRPKTTIDALQGRIETTYDKDGNRLTESDQEGVPTHYAYDTSGRLWRITDAANNVTTLRYGTSVGVQGLLIAMDYPTYTEEYTYDQRGRRTRVTRVLPGEEGEPARRESTTTGYDAVGHRISETDPLQRTTQYAHDALGRLSETTDALGGKTGYAYDARDNLVALTDANGNTHRFTYDKADRVLTEARPLGATIRHAYDETGNLTTRTSPAGERRRFVHDDANRRIEERHYPASSETPSQTVIYAYDEVNRLTGYVQSGDTESQAVYVYDAKGQKTDETVTYDSGPSAFSKTIRYEYLSNGLKRSLTYPDGTEQTTTYDKNRLATIAVQGTTIQYQNYTWQVPTHVTMPGATRTLVYDPLQRPTRIKSESTSGAFIMDYRYTYNAAGNITQRTTEDGDYLYTYDNLDRLTGATPPPAVQQGGANPDGLPVEQYTYDPVHNRMTSAHQPGPWAYNANNELQGYGASTDAKTYQYDANGNTAEERTGNPAAPSTTRQFLYNAAERLSEITDNGATIATYKYDPLGRRFKKEVSGAITWFQYADEGLIAEFAQNGTLKRAYGWKPGNLWGTDPEWLVDVSGTEWTLNLYHNDHLGTSQRLTNISGNVTWSAVSEAFGRTQVQANITDNPLRFPGQHFDGESELNYNYFRDYEPSTGRYVESDPIGLAGGLNFYAYVDSNPLRWIDPEGLAKMCCRLLNSVAGSIGRQRHCYIVADDGTVYGLYPSDGKGEPGINDPKDTGGNCVDCPPFQCSNQNECLRNAHNNYPRGDYSTLGPNSNTYAGTLAKSCCEGGIPSGVSNAPGVNDEPPRTTGGGGGY